MWFPLMGVSRRSCAADRTPGVERLPSPATGYAHPVRPRTLVLVLFPAVLVSACAGVTRPSVAEWEATWMDAVASIPSQQELGEPPSRQLCDDAVAFLRMAESTLLPTPDLAIDATVEEWIAVAKDGFFECPPASAAIPDFEFVYWELLRLQAEVEVVLDLDR